MSRTFHRLRVTLVSSEPEIWREFTIADDLTLLDLHRALQIVVGWRESHMHVFSDTDPYARALPTARKWGDRFTDDAFDLLPEDETTIAEAFAGSGTLWYEYDLGDGWIHRIDALGTDDREQFSPPVSDLDGENRAPYEDSGGVAGYLDKLEIAADPTHPDHGFVTSWIRQTVGPWAPSDPSFFDPLGAQSELNQLFHPAGAGNHPYDMSGIVKDDAHRTPEDMQLESPLVDLLGALPVPLRSELRQRLHRGDLLEPTGLGDDAARRIIAPYAWLLDAVGTEGIDLTEADRLPPRVLLEGMTKLGWLRPRGKSTREDLTVPLALLRETAERMGLVQVQKGRLLLGADAKRALGDAHLLLRLVATHVYRRLQDHERYAAILLFLAIAERTPIERQWEVGAFGLEALGWRSAEPSGSFSRAQIGKVGARTADVVAVLAWNERHDRGSEPSEDLVLFAREALRCR